MTPRPSLRPRAAALATSVAGALVLGTAVPASAVVTVNGSLVSSDAASDDFSVLCQGGVLAATGTATTGSACATLTSLAVIAGGGADAVDLSGVVTADFPQMVVVNSYLDDMVDDTLTGSPLPDFVRADHLDTVIGAGGDDRIEDAGTAVGGLGDDVISGATEYASGGPGDDRFVQFTASGGIDGGDGYDTWEADFDLDSFGTLPPGLTFSMSETSITVAAGAAFESVPLSGLEHVELTLPRAIAKTWDGSGFAGSQNVRALSGDDVVVGGGADDVLHGGSGADTLTGAGGNDVLVGGDGDDVVNARDGAVDRVDCGAGTDIVVADAADVVTGCEDVQLPAVVTPPVATPPPAPTVPETGAVTGRKRVAKPAKARFRFSSPTAGATFQCKVDKGRWKSCSSPHKVATKKLKVGKHTLRVRAVLAGVVDPTPSVRRFRVTR